VSSTAFPYQRLLSVEIFQLPALRSYLHSLLYTSACQLSTELVESSLTRKFRPTVSQPVCLGIKRPSGAYDQIFIAVRQLPVCRCGALSLTRGWVCSLQLLLALASAVILRSESRGTHDHILLSQIRDSLNPEGQVPVFISPRNRMAQLYPQALGPLFVASYDFHTRLKSLNRILAIFKHLVYTCKKTLAIPVAKLVA
jgi:hypothetical protein